MLEGIYAALANYRLSWQIGLASICLAIYCINRFNTRTEAEECLAKDSPPRHYTTKNLYTSYAVLYTLGIEAIYLILLSFPSLLLFIGEQLKIEPLTPELIQGRDFPLILLVLMIAVTPAIKLIRNAEASLRTWFHRQTFIPSQATALINQLLGKPTRFAPELDEAEEILEDLKEYLPENIDPLFPSHDLWHKWFKLLYLRKKIAEWQ